MREYKVLRLISITLALVLLLSLPAIRAYSLQPPSVSADFEVHSARTYMSLEREFVKEFLFDSTFGGTYLSVGGKGNVLNDSKDIIFQSNVILFLAGINTQNPDPDLVRYVDSAASFIVDYLKWGTGGPGTWYASSNRTGGSHQPMTWPAASEAYVSWSLLWAYRITGNQTYLDAVRTNLNYQMLTFPDGHIFTDPLSHRGDITHRSPERMTYFAMWQLTDNRSYLTYAEKIQAAAYGRNALEESSANGTLAVVGMHGMAIVDEVLFALVSGDQTALNEGRQLLEQYRVGGYYSRDDWQNRLVMDLAMWSITHDAKYHDDAVFDYKKVLEFWDPSPPYGFWAQIEKLTKTCFTRGYPTVDMTGPTIAADPQGRVISAVIQDPSFTWLNMTFTGIGVNPNSVLLFYSFDGQTWAGSLQMQTTGGDNYSVEVPQDIAVQNPEYLISASDLFNNTSWVEFTKPLITAQIASTTMSQGPLAVASTSSTVPSLPLVTSANGSFGFGFAVIAAGLLGAALLVIAALVLRPGRRPLPPAESPSRFVCRCPYWWDCYRQHGDCASCNNMRALGGCCMCLAEGARPDYCNHPPLSYRGRSL